MAGGSRHLNIGGRLNCALLHDEQGIIASSLGFCLTFSKLITSLSSEAEEGCNVVGANGDSTNTIPEP